MGKATIEDFKYIGEYRVNYENIDIINTDIKCFKTVTRLSEYRLGGVQEAVDAGIAIYNINIAKTSKDSNGNVKEFKVLDVDIESSNDLLSLNQLIISAVEIQRKAEDGRFLTRNEILNIINNITNDIDKAKKIIPQIKMEIDQIEISEDRVIMGEEV